VRAMDGTHCQWSRLVVVCACRLFVLISTRWGLGVMVVVREAQEHFHGTLETGENSGQEGGQNEKEETLLHTIGY
jgi:hypothetical protein